jgi:hypothetical protein
MLLHILKNSIVANRYKCSLYAPNYIGVSSGGGGGGGGGGGVVLI